MSTTAALSPLAAALAQTVAGYRQARVPIEVLRQAALDADLSLRGSPDARRRLAAALDELAAAGVVRQPTGRAGWEELPRPRLPRWVGRPSTPKPERTPEPPVAWHAALSWVPAFLTGERPTGGERALLRAVNAFLGAGGSALVVPLRERSLQLTGDEKTLDTLSRGRLFTDGRLSMGLIAARRTSPPITRSTVGSGPVTLLVENWSTYESLAANLPADGEVGAVVYSAGNTLGTVLTALADDPPAALSYFGDLDARGLEMPAAADRLAGDLGLPPLTPAAALYRLLAEHGQPAPADTRPDAVRVQRAVQWLPASLRPPVRDVLCTGHRLAQEAVGLELLSATAPAALRDVRRQHPES